MNALQMAAHLAAAAEKSGGADQGWSAPGWLTALASGLVLLLGSSVVASAAGALRASAADRRREYTAAARSLTAWAEYPYRIRRKTSSTPEALSALVDQGHTLQETLADRSAWCAAEHPLLGRVFEHLRAELSASVGPAIETAWKADPVTTGEGMVLGASFVVGADTTKVRACFSDCVRERFGWRRYRPGLHQRLKAHVARQGLGVLG